MKPVRKLFALILLLLVLCTLDLRSVRESVGRFMSRLGGDHPELSTKIPPKRKPHILMWAKVHNENKWTIKPSCPLVDRCTITYNKSTLADADALFFAVRYIDPNNMPSSDLRRPKALNVLFVEEAYENALRIHRLRETPINYFHWIMTFLHDSELLFSFGGPWVPPKVAEKFGYPVDKLPYDAPTVLANKKRPILWTVSNCQTNSRRELAIQHLQKYIAVDIVGRCSKEKANKNLCPKDGRVAQECDFFESYYFLIVVENTVCEEYITEKYWRRYSLPLVPIVMRRKIYESRLPPQSFIAMDDYSGPAEMAAHLKRLMKTAKRKNGTISEYMRFFQWRKAGWAIPPKHSEGYRSGLCQLCEKLLLREPDELLPLPIFNVTQWYEEHSHCERDEFTRAWIHAQNNVTVRR